MAAVRRALAPAALVLWGLIQAVGSACTQAAEGAWSLPVATLDDAKKQAGNLHTAVLAGGCFWGMQAVFEHVKGVRRVLAGYSGGSEASAHYVMVGAGTTGHAESVQITFDPAQLSYGDILRIYFSVAHDPTQRDGQGPDVGVRYRSEIFYRNARQQRIAQAYIGQLQQAGAFSQPIVTRVEPLAGFYPAESYHQDFVAHNADYEYVVQNDLPKIENLKRLFPHLYRQQPVLLARR
jgi:peptide-methionine (S)-S-oxide reductase